MIDYFIDVKELAAKPVFTRR